MKHLAPLLTLFVSLNSFAGDFHRTGLPAVEALVAGDSRVHESIAALSKKLKTPLSLTEMVVNEVRPGQVELCLQLMQVGPETEHEAGVLWVNVEEKTLAGRSGVVRTVQSVEIESGTANENFCP